MVEDDSQELRNDAMLMVQLRNTFYRKKYYFGLGIYLLGVLVILFMLSTIIYLARNPTKPVYFAADELGRLLPDVPLSQPNMSTKEVIDWVTQALQDTLSYDYVNFRGQLQFAQRYFTDYGWRNYMSGLKTSNNLVALTERKLIAIATPAGPAIVNNEGILSGAYAWSIKMPFIITYLFPPYDDKSRFTNPLNFSVIVQRQKILESYKGLGILQLIGDLAITQPVQPLAPVPQ